MVVDQWLEDRPKFTKFPKVFSLSGNDKHFSNTTVSLKLLDEIIIPYVTSECTDEEIDVNHPSLIDVNIINGCFWRAKADPVLLKLRENSIFLVQVPLNMTNLFQSLDLIVKAAAEAYLKRK